MRALGPVGQCDLSGTRDWSLIKVIRQLRASMIVLYNAFLSCPLSVDPPAKQWVSHSLLSALHTWRTAKKKDKGGGDFMERASVVECDEDWGGGGGVFWGLFEAIFASVFFGRCIIGAGWTACGELWDIMNSEYASVFFQGVPGTPGLQGPPGPHGDSGAMVSWIPIAHFTYIFLLSSTWISSCDESTKQPCRAKQINW